jgi:hypothetical protein
MGNRGAINHEAEPFGAAMVATRIHYLFVFVGQDFFDDLVHRAFTAIENSTEFDVVGLMTVILNIPLSLSTFYFFGTRIGVLLSEG